MGNKYTKMDMGIDGHHNGPLVNVGNALKKNIKNPLPPQSPNDCYMQMRFLVNPRIPFAGNTSRLQVYSHLAKKNVPILRNAY